MSYTFTDGQILCPYNPSHILSKLRALPHLEKCRQQNPQLAQSISICTYNQSHHIPRKEMAEHLKICKEHSAARFQYYDTLSYPTSSRMPKPEQINQQKSESKKLVTESSVTAKVNDDINEWM